VLSILIAAIEGAEMTRAQSCCVLLACLVLAPLCASAEPIKIRITLQLPITNHLGVNLTQFKAEVEEKTGKEVSIEIFDNSRLYRDQEVVGAIKSGAIEMGSTGNAMFHKYVPALEVFGQPFLFNFDALVQAATLPDGEFRSLLDKAVLETTGIRILWWQAYGSSVFFSKGRDARTPGAIRGKKVRVWAEHMAKFVRACGGTPVLTSANKQHQAAKDGSVDMIMTGITGVESWKLWEVTDTVTRTEHAALEFLVLINDKVWQSLSEEHKAVISAAARKAERRLRKGMADIEEHAFAFAREKGMTVHELTPDEVAEWRACSAGMIDEYMVSAGDLGRRLMTAYGKLRTDPCCSAGPKGDFTLR
jgi:C4-dicarboxylate-binding protein DctP